MAYLPQKRSLKKENKTLANYSFQRTRNLAGQVDRVVYTQAKSDFIGKVTERAIRYYRKAQLLNSEDTKHPAADLTVRPKNEEIMLPIILKRILGIVSLLIGVALCVWFIYNQFAPTDAYKTNFHSVFKLILPIACLIVGWKLARNKDKSDLTTLKSFTRRSSMTFGNLPFQGHRGKIESIAFSPDDRFVVTGGTERSYGPDRVARVWQIPSGRLMKKLKGHRTGVLSVAVSPDGTAIATGDDVDWKNENQLEGSCIRIWDAAARAGDGTLWRGIISSGSPGLLSGRAVPCQRQQQQLAPGTGLRWTLLTIVGLESGPGSPETR